MRRIDLGPLTPLEFPRGEQTVDPFDYEKWHNWAAGNGGEQLVTRLLEEMDQICQSHGAVLVTTCYYGGYPEHTAPNFVADFTPTDSQFVLLDHAFTGNPLSYGCRRTDGGYDEHYGLVGTKTYARALAPALKRILRSRALGRAKK